MFSLKPSRKKNEIMKFLGFSKIGEENLWKIFHFKNFFFFGRNIFETFSSPILEPSKNCIFSFFFCWVLSVNLFPRKRFLSWRKNSPGKNKKSQDSKIIRLFSRFNLPPPRPHLLLPNPPRSCHQNHQKLILPEQLLPPKPHPRCK